MDEEKTPRQNACHFCDIAAGVIDSDTVFEDRDLLAFLDIGPIRRGHVLIIPRAHIAYFEDLPSGLAHRLMALGQRIARVQKRLYGVERVAFLFAGGDIAHAHAHVVPLVEKTDITSRRYIKEDRVTFQPIPDASPQELALVASELKSALEQP